MTEHIYAVHTPTASHEIVLLSEKPSRDLYLLFYACITDSISRRRRPPSDHQNCLPRSSGITVNVNVDPYMTIRHIRKSVARQKERSL
ncbi:hypothetical protein P5673_022662 [Acropora cervicornis]|uniref:Uncharacterized protein n=1 Tax=Acropora cervicornis TaxID=6130 RepID=A0AAD9Q6U3_ACRCE|nr:hypothetical protein P5673_022662 [Acropora cervicornis]